MEITGYFGLKKKSGQILQCFVGIKIAKVGKKKKFYFCFRVSLGSKQRGGEKVSEVLREANPTEQEEYISCDNIV